MPARRPELEFADEVPWSEQVTSYDQAHLVTYLCLLNASGDEVSEDEMALTVLGIDPAIEPARAQVAVRSHLKRAQWMAKTGYQDLFEG